MKKETQSSRKRSNSARSQKESDVGASQSSSSTKASSWPNERQILFKPERLKYVRKVDKPKGCVFCAAVEKGVGSKSLLLFDGKHAIVILNKYPYNNGHALVLPRRHCGDFLELNPNEQLEINRCLKQVIHALGETYSPAGFNVGLNLGSAAGAGIPEHLHYHVIPRWRGDTNFFPLIAETKVVVETLEQTFDRLIPYFNGKFKKNRAKR